jgi:hypothetical protein
MGLSVRITDRSGSSRTVLVALVVVARPVGVSDFKIIKI